ncbi:MerR family DNA-binding transcriptional regulator [Acinetobacter soli]
MIYRISEFADKCGVNKETIRYYERKNLLQEPHRTEAGYRISVQVIPEMFTLNLFIKKLLSLINLSC